MCIIVQNQGFDFWLHGTFAQPDLTAAAGRHYTWQSNDKSLRAFLLHNISRAEYKIVKHLPTANAVWNSLRLRHENRGLYAQLMLIKECLAIRFTMATPLHETIDQIDDLVARISNMGDIDWNKFKTIMLINALGSELEHIQSQIHGIIDEPGFSAEKIVHRIHRERDLVKHRAAQGEGPTALIAQPKRRERERTICSHCERPGHTAEFCISPGGKFAGHTIEEARIAQRAAWAKERARGTAPSAHIAATGPQNTSRPPSPAPSTTTSNSMLINGVTWVPLPSTTDTAQLALGPIVDPNFEFSAFHATTEADDASHRVSINWDDFSLPTNDASSAYHTFPARNIPQNSPFVLDSGASCHISPERSDFKTLTPTPPHPITGFGGSCIHAIGIGTIELRTKSGSRLTLDRVLFVPNSTVRLISVFSINDSGDNACYFDTNACCVIDPGGTVILTGTAWKQRRLYRLDCLPRSVDDSDVNEPSLASSHPTKCSALYATKAPDLETWHRRLGHCNYRTIIDMARRGAVEGMPIDLSSAPAACDHCILGKQTRSHVPAVREGERARKRLERVFIDLCGPMPAVSSHSHLYSMNVIDDFSSYVWSLPLARKSDAVNVLRAWHRAVENQTGERLKIIVTDNGELVSQTMATWCSLHGIEHQLTAPYTSAHNGRAERLHRTLLGKARAMRLSCNAPPKLWDEFCATAAYLTNFTATSSLHGKTPYELWFGQKPSLSHLREIGCRAFSLIQTHNPKIFQRSTPCILIGYAPRAKAYRLWDVTTGKVFNSFHVTFVEHLQSQPTDLLPGTTVNLNPDAPPTWAALPIPAPSSRPFPAITSPPTDPILPTSPPVTPTSSNNVNTVSNTVTANNNTDNNSNNNTVTNTVTNNDNNNNNTSSNVPITITIPPTTIPADPSPPPLRRSARLAARQPQSAETLHAAFLSQYIPFFATHDDLLPLDFSPSDFESIDVLVSSLSDGSAEPDFDTNDDPSWVTAMRSSEREYWIAGAREELRSLSDLQVFTLIPRSDVPRGRRPLKGKLVCKRKRDDAGNVVRYKVRYVAKGYTQRYGVDYDKTTAPTARLESFRTLLHLAASLGWDVQHIDIKTAFLHGLLPADETAYLEQPVGFEEPGKEDWVMQLRKSIYGMKQAGRIWNRTFHDTVTSWGFEQNRKDPCVYRRQSATGTVMFGVHVDDIYSIADPPEENARFKEQLRSKWDISDLGEINFILGIAIERDRGSRSISLNQTAFIDRLVSRFNLSDARPVDTPMTQGLQIRRPDKSIPPDPALLEWIERTPYRELIGSLNYIAVATRPDISFALGRLASVLDCYRPEHWSAGLRVLRYLKGTRSLRLVLGGTNPNALSGFCDSDYANCQDTSRSITGYCFTLGSGVISWRSKKHDHASDSSCYAEYIALHAGSQEAIFLRELLQGLRVLKADGDECPPTQLYCDNEAATRLSQESVWHSNTKHFRAKYHSIRDNVRDGVLRVDRIPSAGILSDILTKATSRTVFEQLRPRLGLSGPDCVRHTGSGGAD